MRKLLIILLFILCSCSSFNDKTAIEHKDKLTNVVRELKSIDKYWFDSDDIESYINEDISMICIHYIVKNVGEKNSNYSGFFEENDSLVIFINRWGNSGDPEYRIIHDYSQKPRNYGNKTIDEKSYRIRQLDERWYYSQIGIN